MYRQLTLVISNSKADSVSFVNWVVQVLIYYVCTYSGMCFAHLIHLEKHVEQWDREGILQWKTKFLTFYSKFSKAFMGMKSNDKSNCSWKSQCGSNTERYCFFWISSKLLLIFFSTKNLNLGHFGSNFTCLTLFTVFFLSFNIWLTFELSSWSLCALLNSCYRSSNPSIHICWRRYIVSWHSSYENVPFTNLPLFLLRFLL